MRHRFLGDRQRKWLFLLVVAVVLVTMSSWGANHHQPGGTESEHHHAGSDFAILQVFVPTTKKWEDTEETSATITSNTTVGTGPSWLMRQSTNGWRSYAARHGYTYRLVQERMGDADMPIHFVRFLAMLELLKTHRWVFYVDADVIVHRPQDPLTLLTSAHPGCAILATDMRDLYARFNWARKPCPRGDASQHACFSRLNAGVLLVQRGRATVSLLEAAVHRWPNYTEWIVNGQTGLDQVGAGAGGGLAGFDHRPT